MTKFRATLDLEGKTATGITVPADVVAALGAGKRPKVRVTLHGHTFGSTLGALNGLAKIPVSAAVREAAAVSAGDVLEVELELDDEPRVAAVPTDLAAALQAAPAALRFFAGLSYSKQHAYALWVDSAKKPETRQRRLEEAVALLAAGRPQR